MTIKIGFMQGRLLPKYDGIYQCYPRDWLKELEIASKNNYNCFEWIVDEKSRKFNALLFKEKRLEVIKATNKFGVLINSICADILLENILYSDYVIETWREILDLLLKAAYEVKCKTIVIPLLEKMSIRYKFNYENSIKIFKNIIPKFEEKEIKIAFELDVEPELVKKFLNNLNSKIVGINYDSGNSAAEGFNIYEEFKTYKEKIFNFHIKDRFHNGSPTLLGTGNANLLFLAKQLSTNFQGNAIIFQSFRDEKGLEITNLQRDWFMNLYKNNFTI